MLGPEARRSIKYQRLSKLIVHEREIIPRINLSRAAEKELVKRLERSRTQRVDGASQVDLRKKRLGACNGHGLEVVREYPHPIRNQVMPSKGHTPLTTGHTLAG